MAFTRVHKLAKAAPISEPAVKPLVTRKVEDWHGEYAYSLGCRRSSTDFRISTTPRRVTSG